MNVGRILLCVDVNRTLSVKRSAIALHLLIDRSPRRRSLFPVLRSGEVSNAALNQNQPTAGCTDLE